MNKLKKCILLTAIVTLLLMGNVFASGFNISFYQAMEGNEIDMVDANGNVVETVTIDAMGRASFTKALSEGMTLEMDLANPEDMATINERTVYGYGLSVVIGVALAVGLLTFAITAIYIRRTNSKKYEFLTDYLYNEVLDKQNE